MSHWSRKDTSVLMQGAGTYGMRYLQRKCGHRSVAAIRAKAQRLYGQGGLTRGSYSLSEVCKITGYCPKNIRRAARALSQNWKRLSERGSYLIYEEQLKELIDWLSKGYWSKKHRLYNCLWCYTERQPHRALGLCIYCYCQYAKRMERSRLPRGKEALLKVARRKLKGLFLEKAIVALSRGRALPEDVLAKMVQK